MLLEARRLRRYTCQMTVLYRILSAADWQATQAASSFVGSADDQRDGFIHLSAAHQVTETAAKHYAGRADLILLWIGSEELSKLRPGALKWETSRGGDRFPHLYGSLPIEAVERAQPLPLGPDGRYVFQDLRA